MRAVVLATGLFKNEEGVGDSRAVGLQTVAGKPWAQHIVESLFARGVRNIDLVLWHHAHRYEQLLGEGERWGGSITYHFAFPLETPLSCMKGLSGEGSVWLASESGLLLDDLDSGKETHLFDSEKERWVASYIEWSKLQALCDKTLEEMVQEFREQTDNRGECEALFMVEPNDVLAVNHHFLDGGRGLLAAGREIEPGVWMGRNVMLHPTARLVPPVFLGPHSQIGPSVELGPYASIGDHCFVGSHTRVENSVIQSGSFLGDDLELVDSLSDRDFIYQVPLAVRFPVVDADIAGRSQESVGAVLLSLSQRLIALVLLLLFAPLSLGRSLYRKRYSIGLTRVEYVQQPAINDSLAWQMASRWREDSAQPTSLKDHFWRDFLPGLPQAVSGSLAVVGTKPRTESELEELPSDWRARVLTSQVGLVTEALAFCGATANEDEEYLCEAYFAKNRSLGRVLTLLVRYLASVVMEPPE